MLMRNSRKYLILGLFAVLLLVAATGCVPEMGGLFVGMDEEGITEDGVEYDVNDILYLEEVGTSGEPTAFASNWISAFDGELYGLNDEKHNISAFSFNDLILDFNLLTSELDEGTELYLSFEDNRARVPGIPGWVHGQDVVKFTMGETGGTVANTAAYSYEMYFDGSDVSLTNNSEKLDGLSVWPPENYELLANDIELPVDCSAGVIFISTVGSHRVTDNLGGHLVGDGSDVLAFCATNVGADTAGFWLRVFDGSEASLKPRNAIRGIDVWAVNIDEYEAGVDSGNYDFGVLFSFTSGAEFSAEGTSGTVVGGPNDFFVGASVDSIHEVEGPFGNFNSGDSFPAVNGVVESFAIFDVSLPTPP